MDLSNYTLEELLQSAIKSEVESNEVYTKLAGRVGNFVLKDRLNFLADEELKHKKFIESLHKKNLPDVEITLPEKSPVPLPKVNIEDENMELRELFFQAMEAEKAANEFYLGFADRYQDDTEIKNTLIYLASMEMNHYHILETEHDSIDMFEEYETGWPFIHIGP